VFEPSKKIGKPAGEFPVGRDSVLVTHFGISFTAVPRFSLEPIQPADFEKSKYDHSNQSAWMVAGGGSRKIKIGLPAA